MLVAEAAEKEAAEKEPNYVIFTIMGPQGLGPEAVQAESVVPETVWDAREKNAVQEIRGEFGEQQANQQRYVGFSVSLTPTLNLKHAQLKVQIVYAMDLADRNKIPVFFIWMISTSGGAVPNSCTIRKWWNGPTAPNRVPITYLCC